MDNPNAKQRRRVNGYFEFRSTLGRVRDAAAILANWHGWDSRVTLIGTRHLLIAWHWHPSDRGAEARRG